MALNQHFANAGGYSEIAVDLERRVIIEKVRQGTAAKMFAAVFCSFVAVSKSRKEVDGPRT